MSDRMTAAEFRATQEKPKRAKYGNQKATLQGVLFDSAREARRWLVLQDMLRRGEITDLERQVSIELQGQHAGLLTPKGRPMRYIADFAYVCRETGLLIHEDAKGFATPEYKVKAAVVRAMKLHLREV